MIILKYKASAKNHKNTKEKKMPYISVKTALKPEKNQVEAIKTAFGKAIEIIPGKTERWLMVSFETQDYLFFSGDSMPAAMIEVSVFGKTKPEFYEKLTAKICDIIEKELEIPQEKIYVKYSETENWGWNGKNF